MEFRMTTDLSTALKPQEIAFNYDELKTQLAEKLEKYKGLLVTEDGIAEAFIEFAKKEGLSFFQ